MLAFPNCKINLGLYITGRRADGYHDLSTLFYPLPLKDALEIVERPTFSFKSTGLPIEGNIENNLCVKAYELLREKYNLPPVLIHLHKVIPMGAGLGGGSADGAFTLQLLNDKFNLNIATDTLIDYALWLGSDCPFFILNKPCLASGRGEILEPIKLDLSNYRFALVHPGIHVNTRWAFSQIVASPPSIPVRDIIALPVEQWKDHLKNDFEEPVFQHHPVLHTIKQQLYQSGAIYVSMTGSGSSLFAIFKKDVPINIPLINPSSTLNVTLI